MEDNLELIFKPSIRENAEAQQNVREWVEALRSGKYEQCRGLLHLPGDGFCCLGVRLDSIDCNAWSRSIYETGMRWKFWDSRLEDMTYEILALPDPVWKAMHLRDSIGSFVNPDASVFESSDEPLNDSLTNWNDRGRSFSSIADKIERDLEAVLAG